MAFPFGTGVPYFCLGGGTGFPFPQDTQAAGAIDRGASFAAGPVPHGVGCADGTYLELFRNRHRSIAIESFIVPQVHPRANADVRRRRVDNWRGNANAAIEAREYPTLDSTQEQAGHVARAVLEPPHIQDRRIDAAVPIQGVAALQMRRTSGAH